jgi:hypothetical protein
MSTSPTDKGETPTPPEKSTVILLLGDIGDTTWRMFVPTIGFTLVGLYADTMFGTKPWLMVTGIIIGSIFAGLLVKKQLQKVNK